MTASEDRSPAGRLRRLAADLGGVLSATGPVTTGRYLVCIARRLPEIARTGTLAPADDLMGRGGACRFRVLGVAVTLDGDQFGGGREMYARRVYFPRRVPDLRIRPGDTVVDLGANQGLFTTFAARLARRVLAVEAQSGFLPVIERNARRNRPVGSLEVEHALVGEGSGVVTDPSWTTRASHFGTPPPVVGLDKLLDAHGIDRVDFLKVDIEGSEYALFADAGAWLPKVRAVAMEVHTGFGDPSALRDTLADAGFVTMMAGNSGRPVDRIREGSGYLYAWRP